MWSHRKGVPSGTIWAVRARFMWIGEREPSKRFGIARKTVHKMLSYSAPQG
ncbi:MAG: hypothetical protein QOJ99_4836 [Bryobacterales bacterium]|nr:hypothetical protein [Bryobacterales bacterium]